MQRSPPADRAGKLASEPEAVRLDHPNQPSRSSPRSSITETQRHKRLYTRLLQSYPRRVSDQPIVKVVVTMGGVVGLLTGIGTLVGWASSASFRDSAAVALAAGGAIYLVGGGAFLLFEAITGGPRSDGVSVGTR